MVEVINNKDDFKKQNQNSWNLNADFVIANGFPHIEVENILYKEINQLLTNDTRLNSILDVGCGTGWLKEVLESTRLKYVGVDNCEVFINKRAINYPNNFFVIDIENEIKRKIINRFKSDIVVSCLSLIETPYLNKSFENLSSLCNEKGYLLVVSLNPIIELFRVSRSFEEFEKYIELYKREDIISISKKIKRKGIASKSNYYRILYRISDYIKNANEFGFNLINLVDNLNGKGLGKDPVYQFLLFQKM